MKSAVRNLKSAIALLAICLGGCRLIGYGLKPAVQGTTGEALARFNAAGPIVPAIPPDKFPAPRPLAFPYRLVAGDVLEVRIRVGQDAAEWVAQQPDERGRGGAEARTPDRLAMYRVRSGDVLDFVMPAVLRGVGESVEGAASYACRVGESGGVWLPVIGELAVGGKTLLEVEAAVVAAYFPKYVKSRPSVVARVSERGTSLLSAVAGAAGVPGVRDPFAEAFLCRVSDAGAIRLPLIGEVAVAGKAVAEIEAAVAAAYHPKYVASPPTVVAKVADYHTAVVYAIGAVGSPGRHELRSNEMELAVLLAKAGGIGVSTRASGGAAGGAKIIRIRHAGQARDAKPLEVPVRDRNIPVANVALQDGDIVEVEHYDDPLFTVTGLVMNPGVHPYPPTARYSLQQALAMSGGIDVQAGPRYAMVYRQDVDGKVAAGEFKIGGRTMIEASDVLIKPGDVICLEHSIRTRWNKFWATVLHFGAGAYATVPITMGSSTR